MAGANTTENENAEVATRFVYRYHNDSLGFLNILLLGFAGLLALLGLFIFVQIGTEPKPLHFPVNSGYELIDPVPLDKEGITTAALLNWVNEIVMEAFSFNYSNVVRQQSKMQPYFSDAAMKLYMDMLTTDEDFSNIAQNKFVVSVVPQQAPEILVGQAYEGRFAWQIKSPIKVTFGNAIMSSSQIMVLKFLIIRVPATQNPLGITVATYTRDVIGREALHNLRGGF